MIKKREHWGSRLGFILAAAGSAIGLGSLWRFPYMAGENGGGAFVILYIIFTLILGLPVFMGEIIIGRKSQKAAVLAYPTLVGKEGWKVVGLLNCLTCFLILSYYCVVSGWCTNYIVMSINSFWHGRTPDEIRQVFDIVSDSPSINIFWLLIYMVINVVVLSGGIRHGIEKWSKILMPILFVLLIALFVLGTTMSGFGQAVRYIFVPDMAKMTPSVVLNALGMALFTLSVGLGVIVTYGSYLKSGENVAKMSVLVVTLTILVSLISAMMVYPIVFTHNFPIEGGPGLIFKTLPVLFAMIPGSLLISTAFFTLVMFMALTSSISLLEVLVANLMETLEWSRKKALGISASAIFIFALPSTTNLIFPHWKMIYGKTFFDTVSYISGSWMIPLSALLTTLFLGFFLKKACVKEDYLHGGASPFFFYPWHFIIRYLAPLAVLIILLHEAWTG